MNALGPEAVQRTQLHGPARLWSFAVADFALKHFDAITWLIRHAESQYQAWTLNPPPPGVETGGLFGLGGGGGLGLAGANALAPQRVVIPDEVPPARLDDQRRTLTFVERLCADLELQGALDRVSVFRSKLDGIYPRYSDCHGEWRALREQIEKEIERCRLFYMRREAAAAIFSADKDWLSTCIAFPSVRRDIKSALRCFAFEQYTASVFHFMRVAEAGLRAVAKERKLRLPKDKPIEAAQWSELTNRLNTVIEKVHNWKAKDTKKQPALDFYTAVRADTVFFKDRYRNIVSHSLAHFDEPEASSVARRVQEFMDVVSSRLGEDAEPIRWTK